MKYLGRYVPYCVDTLVGMAGEREPHWAWLLIFLSTLTYVGTLNESRACQPFFAKGWQSTPIVLLIIFEVQISTEPFSN